jgi:hypothetical protein
MQGGEQHVVISGQINALPVMSFMRLDMQLDYGISKVEKTETSMWGFDWRIFQMEFSQMEHMIGRRIWYTTLMSILPMVTMWMNTIIVP